MTDRELNSNEAPTPPPAPEQRESAQRAAPEPPRRQGPGLPTQDPDRDVAPDPPPEPVTAPTPPTPSAPLSPPPSPPWERQQPPAAPAPGSHQGHAPAPSTAGADRQGASSGAHRDESPGEPTGPQLAPDEDVTQVYQRRDFPLPPMRDAPDVGGDGPAPPRPDREGRPSGADAAPGEWGAEPQRRPTGQQQPPRHPDESAAATAPFVRQARGEAPPRQPEPGRWAEQPRSSAPSAGPANWSIVDGIRSSELVPTRKIPPGRGWRRVVYRGTFGLINFGRSPDERRLAELEARIRSLLRGRYKIGVMGKGGTGKTTVAAGVGSIFAELRQDDRVVAIDADIAFGKLGSRIDPNAKGSYWELAADEYLHSFADVRSRVGNNAAGLFVLAGESATARRRVLDPAIYREATARLDAHFTISIVDCGSTVDSPVTQEVLRDLDALIVVSSPWVDGASAAGQTMEWLANNGYTGLLHRTVVVLDDSDGHADKRTRALLVEQFSQRGQVVIELPFDAHLRPGGVVDVQNEVDKTTRRRLIEIAAAIAEHFPTTTDGPRERR